LVIFYWSMFLYVTFHILCFTNLFLHMLCHTFLPFAARRSPFIACHSSCQLIYWISTFLFSGFPVFQISNFLFLYLLRIFSCCNGSIIIVVLFNLTRKGSKNNHQGPFVIERLLHHASSLCGDLLYLFLFRPFLLGGKSNVVGIAFAS